MRLYRIDSGHVEATISAPTACGSDVRGNARLAGMTADGRPIIVVVAGDDPRFVITVFVRA